MTQYRNLIGIFLTVALVILVSIVMIFLTGKEGIEARREIQTHMAAIQRLDDFLLTLTTAETGQRGYLLTGSEEYLRPYDDAAPQVASEIRDLARNDQFPKEEVHSLQANATEKLAELARTIELRRTRGAAAAAAVVETNVGRKLMDEIRDLIFTARITQQDEMERASIRNENAALLRNITYGLAALVNSFFLAWAYLRISRDTERRDQAYADLACERQEVHRQKEFLNVTLGSIGDCVIVSDIQGRITFMNEVAENVTGWSKEEAVSQPVASVFRIINEHTREAVESPVEKVLRSGKIVGLANHTLLIRKDGTEIPIDDSGAPIREPGGALRGVVLVFRDFTEYKNSENELIQAKSVAEAASKAKDQFLAMLSHELRTPLTPVLATLNRWEITHELPEALHTDIEMVRRSVELEARIIDDLLDLTRISKGILSLTPEQTNVHGLLESLAGMYRSEIQAKDLRLTMQLNASRPYVYLDASRLQQVMWNLLRNAAKFTERGGAITVETANDASGQILISVTDTGIGMDESTLSRLFIPFEQGEKDLSRRYGGLGLGLAISRALVDLLGGEISAASEGPGQGSQFEVTFPGIEWEPSSQNGLADTEESRVSRAKLRILLVEDHADTGLAMSRLLEARGHQICMADSVSSAKELIEAADFDLLLCDLGLPDGTGIDVISHLRRLRATPAIALSGFGMEEDLVRCIDAGFDLHITKPVNIKQLEASIERLIESKEQTAAL
jgi:PAS domain S-box-containing protein